MSQFVRGGEWLIFCVRRPANRGDLDYYVCSRLPTPMYLVEIRRGRSTRQGVANEADRALPGRAGPRGRAFKTNVGAGPGGQVRLETARQVDDLRVSRGHGGDDPVVDHHGDHAELARRGAGGR